MNWDYEPSGSAVTIQVAVKALFGSPGILAGVALTKSNSPAGMSALPRWPEQLRSAFAIVQNGRATLSPPPLCLVPHLWLNGGGIRSAKRRRTTSR